MTQGEHLRRGPREQLAVLRRRAWIVVLAVVITTASAIGFSTHETALYQSSAKVFVNPSSELTNGAAATAADAQSRFLATEAALAHTPTVAAHALRLSGQPGSAAALLGDTTVSADPSSNILTISVDAANRAAATALATSYANAFQRESTKTGLTGIDQATARLTGQIATVQQQIRTAKAAGQSRAAFYAQLSSLVREQQRLQELRAIQPAAARVVQLPSSASQVRPATRRNAALGLIVGLVLGICLVFLREALDTRVRSAEEVAERLGMPLLARLPVPTVDSSSLSLTGRGDARAADAYHKLRLALDFAAVGQPVQRMMVTSALEGEGKSTTVANLAVAYASTGRDVAVVDLDVRRSSVAGFFGLTNAPGITDVLAGHAEMSDAISDFRVESPTGDTGLLRVVPAGTPPPSPTELLAATSLARCIDEIAASVDLILIDSPPMIPVSDGLVIARLVDSALAVTRSTEVRAPALAELRRLMEQSGVRRLGFAVTNAERDSDYAAIYNSGGYGNYQQSPDAAPEVTLTSVGEPLTEIRA